MYGEKLQRLNPQSHFQFSLKTSCYSPEGRAENGFFEESLFVLGSWMSFLAGVVWSWFGLYFC